MKKNVLHVSEADVATGLSNLIARVQAGDEVIIENGERPVAVLHAIEPSRRTISECIALATTHENEAGTAPILDTDFAKDVEQVLRTRRPWNPPAWE